MLFLGTERRRAVSTENGNGPESFRIIGYVMRAHQQVLFISFLTALSGDRGFPSASSLRQKAQELLPFSPLSCVIC